MYQAYYIISVDLTTLFILFWKSLVIDGKTIITSVSVGQIEDHGRPQGRARGGP